MKEIGVCSQWRSSSALLIDLEQLLLLQLLAQRFSWIPLEACNGFFSSDKSSPWWIFFLFCFYHPELFVVAHCSGTGGFLFSWGAVCDLFGCESSVLDCASHNSFSINPALIFIKSWHFYSWKSPLISSSPTLDPALPSPSLIPKCQMQMIFEHSPGWWLHHFPGHPLPLPDHLSSEEIFLISSLNLAWHDLRPLFLLIFLTGLFWGFSENLHGRILVRDLWLEPKMQVFYDG